MKESFQHSAFSLQLKKIAAVAFCYLLAAVPLWPGTCTLTNNSGSACASKTCTLSAIAADTSHANWTGTGCTATGYVPSGTGNYNTAPNDSVVIPDGYSLTANQNWTIGASGAINTTAAVSMANTGRLIVATGATLTARGDILASGGYSGNPAFLTLNAGSGLTFDSTQSASPTATRYRVGTTASFDPGRQIVMSGTSGSHVTVTSNLTGGALAGQFRAGTATVGAGYSYGVANHSVAYVDFSNIGDATTYGQAWTPADNGAANVTASITHSTWNNSGEYLWHLTTNVASDVWTYSNNVHTNSLSALNGTMFRLASWQSNYSGAATISNNVFDAPFNCAGYGPFGIPFTGNYFGAGNCAGGGSATTVMADNFFRPQTNTPVYLYADPNTGSYVFGDYAGEDNPHVLVGGAGASPTISGGAVEYTDDFTSDSGEMDVTNGNSPYLSSMQNMILVPSKTGKGTMELQSYTHFAPPAGYGTGALLHNTWVASNGFGMFQTNEGGADLSAMNLVESNLAWSAGGTYCKVSTFASSGVFNNPVTTADYNYGDQYMLPDSLSPHACSVSCSAGDCPHQGNGYAGSWSATPGTHDLDVVNPSVKSPYLADPYLRNVALWDTRYLGNAAGAAWQTSTAYTVGQIVSDSHAGYWQGATVNFRCIANHTSAAATEPNVGANWRNDWEFASLYDLRTATAAGSTYTDGAIGCSGCTAIQALVKWVRRGFTPQNPALWCAGHDGEAIGAVPFCAKGKVMLGILAGM